MAVARALCPVVVGREGQLSELEDALLEALRGQGGVLLLSGDAGMGKSRLAAELSDRGERLGCAVLFGGCSEAELALPYLPFLEAIGNHLSRADVAALRERLGPAAAELAQLFPQLGDAAPQQPDQTGKLRLFEAVVAILGDAAREHGLLLVVEDIHWADPSTRELLDYLTRRLRAERVLLLATLRSDELHRKHPLLPTIQGWRRASMVREIELSALDSEQVGGMVQAILDQREAVSADFRTFLRERTEGNPFVLEEMLKAAIDRGDVYRDEGGWNRKEITELLLPDTVRDTILLRIERLGDDEREVLSAASVVGRAFDLATLVAVTERDEDSVVRALHACVLQQLLEEDDRSAGTYRFRHALTREAVYEDLLQPQRKRLHARVADALRGQPSVRSVDLANHLLRAGLTEEGAELCVVAAQEAAAAIAFSDAAVLYQRAADLAEGKRRGELLSLAGVERWNNEEPDAARRLFEESVPLLEAAGETVAGAEARLWLGRCHWEQLRSDLARAEYERALQVLEPLGPSPALARAYLRLAAQDVFDERAEAALANGTKANEVARECGDQLDEAWSWNFIGLAKMHMGRVREGLDDLERSHRESAAGGYRFQTYNAIYNAGVTLTTMGSGRLAARWLARPFMGNSLAAAYLYALDLVQRGEAAEAIRQTRSARETALLARHGKFDWRLSEVLAHALVEADEPAEAATVLPPASATVDAQDFLTDVPGRIRIAQATGDMAEAQRVAREVPPTACTYGSPADFVADVMAGDPGWLRTFLEAAEPPGELAETPRWRYALAILAVAEARADAVDTARAAVGTLRDEGYRLAAWHLQRFVARALAAGGDPGGARAELESAVAEATAAGALLAARLARETAAELGFELAPAEILPAVAEPGEVGEKLVTVLFADVRGYTSFTAQTAPAGLADKVGSLQRWAADEVRKHHGVVDKFAGDAVMATFNAAGTSVDHTEHALEAALAIRDKAALLGLPVGVGIAVGPAVVGRLANGGNLSVLGEVTNLAARLQASAGAGEVRLSAEAHRRVRERLASRGVSAVPLELELKGFEAPVPAFNLS
jgi:class 3 adenylate cyclase/tetratricopeptide (TPR) repeat protein